jgi:hypothetical protein
MTTAFMVIGTGPYRLGIDTQQVHQIYPERDSSAELLADWQAFKKKAGDTGGRIPLLSLTEILLGRKDDMMGPRRLVVLSGETTIGLIVDDVATRHDVDQAGLQPLPGAFSGTCRRLFDQVALCGDIAVPVLTGGALLALSSAGGREER